MNGREWKPGDVAMVTWKAMGVVRTDVRIRANSCRIGDVWWGADGYIGDSTAKEIRPLVVVDPEDREQIEALLVAFLRDYDAMDSEPQPEEVTSMQAALRSLITPPKPEEPLGLGAVVLDSQGVEVVHIGDGIWTRNGGPRAEYALVDAVKVLSEGVTA